MTVLDAGRLAAWHRDGFLVLPDFVSRESCARVLDATHRYLDGIDADTHRSVFTTEEQTRTSDDYFLGSGDTVRFFWEDEALDDTGRLTRPVRHAVNKIGHALHDLDPDFDAFSRQPPVGTVVEELGIASPGLLQSMVICKPPGIGGEVTPHQDATFLWTDPVTVIGLWFALEDATVDNGCLWAVPGGHRGPLRQRFRRADGGGTAFDLLDPTPLSTDGAVPLEAGVGTMVVLHGRSPHFSAANRSTASRIAYSLHVIDTNAHYPADNWLQRGPAMPLRGF